MAAFTEMERVAVVANLLNSTVSNNWFFGTGILDYGTPPNSYVAMHKFYTPESAAEFSLWIGISVLFATLSTRVGFAWGEWMKRIKR